MLEEEKNELNNLIYVLETHHINSSILVKMKDLIEKKQKEIENKDKTIDEMAKWIFDKDYTENSLFIHRDDYYTNCIKQVKQYFEKKVAGE